MFLQVSEEKFSPFELRDESGPQSSSYSRFKCLELSGIGCYLEVICPTAIPSIEGVKRVFEG